MQASFTQRTSYVKSGQIGCAHDPYSTKSVIAINGTRHAEFYVDGLGKHQLVLKDGNDISRDETWFDGTARSQDFARHANMLFKRWVGVSIEEVEQEYYSREEDPMDHHCRGYM